MALVDNGLQMTFNCAFQRRAISAKKRKMQSPFETNIVQVAVITVEPTGTEASFVLQLHADEAGGLIQWKMTH